jgi:hypothetical protein
LVVLPRSSSGSSKVAGLVCPEVLVPLHVMLRLRRRCVRIVRMLVVHRLLVLLVLLVMVSLSGRPDTRTRTRTVRLMVLRRLLMGWRVMRIRRALLPLLLPLLLLPLLLFLIVTLPLPPSLLLLLLLLLLLRHTVLLLLLLLPVLPRRSLSSALD